MESSFEPLADSENVASSPDWIAHLRSTSGFVATNLHGRESSDQISETTESFEENSLETAYSEGHAAGRSEAEVAFAKVQESRARFRQAWDSLDDVSIAALKSALADTVAHLCEQIIEPALIDRNALQKRCENAVAALGESPARLTLHVHPEDAPMIESGTDAGMKVRPDESLTRGSIWLEGPDGIVSDGPEDWRRMLREALTP